MLTRFKTTSMNEAARLALAYVDKETTRVGFDAPGGPRVVEGKVFHIEPVEPLASGEPVWEITMEGADVRPST